MHSPLKCQFCRDIIEVVFAWLAIVCYLCPQKNCKYEKIFDNGCFFLCHDDNEGTDTVLSSSCRLF